MKNNIGEARRNYADRIGKFTQDDAAQFFGVSLSTYKKWEQGQGMMNGEQLREIAMKYDTTVDYLLGITEIDYAVVELPSEEPKKLSSDETELLTLYRMMSPDMQRTLLETARNFAALRGVVKH